MTYKRFEEVPVWQAAITLGQQIYTLTARPAQAESISRQLRAWADSLQNTSIKGQRYLDERARKREKAARDREEFLKELNEIRTAGGRAE